VSVTLRPAAVADIDFFYRLQQDPVAVWMAAFTSSELGDWAAFERRWQRVLTEPGVTVFLVLDDVLPIGQVLAFGLPDQPEVGYWIEREHWGRGYAGEALRLLLDRVAARPVTARVAQDNVASLAVLRRNGFTITGEDRGPAAGRGQLVREYVLRLSADP
jgi:RimJ/RimL family protein N-acetyltransferase